MIIGENTLVRVAQAITDWLHSNTSEIDRVYQEAGNDLNISISVKFYTDKTGRHKRRIKGKFPTGHIILEDDDEVNEAQKQLPGMD